jgi:hypothetical protein
VLLRGNFLYSGLVTVKFVLRDTDMIDRDRTSLGAEFGERAADCVELEPVRVDEIERLDSVGFGISSGSPIASLAARWVLTMTSSCVLVVLSSCVLVVVGWVKMANHRCCVSVNVC